MSATLAIALAGACAALLAWDGLDLIFAQDRRVTRRLHELDSYEAGQVLEAEPLLTPLSSRLGAPLRAAFRAAALHLWPASHVERLRFRLSVAGDPRSMTAERFLSLQLALSLGAGMLALATGIVFAVRPGAALPLILLGAALGLFAPEVWLSRIIAGRRRRMRRALPDMLDMLTVSVEAGLGFDAALQRLVRMGEGPLAQEFARMLQRVQAGIGRAEALHDLARRADQPEFASFVSAIVQADLFGVSIAQVLRTQSVELRMRRRQHAEEEAQKAPVKLVLPLVLCILPATMIVILGPAVLRIGEAFGFMS